MLAGPEGLVRLVAESGADLVLNAIVGSAGLGPTIVALTEGIDVALANKESLVVGGELVMALCEATGAQLIPVDSEHSALHQLIEGERPGTVERLTLTASGGPFRGRSRAELADVTVDAALRHPTWAMGGKITIDSATLMNKGLEVIEAHWLFGTPYDRIDVVVHPQSIVHALVGLCDGATLAHMGTRTCASRSPTRCTTPTASTCRCPTLDLAAVGALEFEPPDLDAFPCLRLAREAAQAGGTATCVLNAANEVAVHAFLSGRLDFMGIPAVIESALEQLPAARVHSFETLYRADAEARRRRGGDGRGARLSWVLAFLGFAALIILHEAGHFAAAKAVGMRVERFALFFPPLLARVRRGETEYAVGAVPLGGYVKITGMNPAEEIPPEVAHRAYYRQPVWKRIVVIAAGPAVNIVLALVLLVVIFLGWGVYDGTSDRIAGRRQEQGRRAGAAARRPRHRGRRQARRAPRRCASRSRRTAAPASRSTAARRPSPRASPWSATGASRRSRSRPSTRPTSSARWSASAGRRVARRRRRRGGRARASRGCGSSRRGPSRRSRGSSRPRSASRSRASSGPTR